MSNIQEEAVSKITAALPLLLTSLEISEITNIILLIIGIVSSIISTSFTIWKWYIKSMHDKKITIEEIEELNNDLRNIKIKRLKKPLVPTMKEEEKRKRE